MNPPPSRPLRPPPLRRKTTGFSFPKNASTDDDASYRTMQPTTLAPTTLSPTIPDAAIILFQLDSLYDGNQFPRTTVNAACSAKATTLSLSCQHIATFLDDPDAMATMYDFSPMRPVIGPTRIPVHSRWDQLIEVGISNMDTSFYDAGVGGAMYWYNGEGAKCLDGSTFATTANNGEQRNPNSTSLDNGNTAPPSYPCSAFAGITCVCVEPPTPTPGPTGIPTSAPTFQPTNVPTSAPTRAAGIVLYDVPSVVYPSQVGNRAASSAACTAAWSGSGICQKNLAVVSYTSDTILNLATTHSFGNSLPVYGPTGIVVAPRWIDFISAGTFSPTQTTSLLGAGVTTRSRFWTGGTTSVTDEVTCSQWTSNSSTTGGGSPARVIRGTSTSLNDGNLFASGSEVSPPLCSENFEDPAYSNTLVCMCVEGGTSRPTSAPTTLAPTNAPTAPTTLAPTLNPTTAPTQNPTAAPTRAPGIRLYTIASTLTGGDFLFGGRTGVDIGCGARSGSLGYSCSQSRALITDATVSIANLASSFSFSTSLVVYGVTTNAVVAPTWADFLAGTSIVQSMTSAGLPSGLHWTGGRTGGDRCSDWTTTAGNGLRGNMAATTQSGMFDDASVSCASSLYVVCLCVET